MKKLYLTLLATTFCIWTFAGGGCTPDVNNTAFFNPTPDSLPCVERNTSYNQVIQIYVPTTFDLSTFIPNLPFPVTVTVDSLVVNNVTGLPSGLGYGINPTNGIFYGGTNGCVLVSGTTSDPAGNYPLTLDGTISLSGLPVVPGFNDNADTTLDLATLQSLAPGQFALFVDVIEPGSPCRTTSVKNFNAALNAAMFVYPNPAKGYLNFTLNTGRTIQGSVSIFDFTGKKMLEQLVQTNGLYTTVINVEDLPAGLYNVTLSTPEGFASKTISIE